MQHSYEKLLACLLCITVSNISESPSSSVPAIFFSPSEEPMLRALPLRAGQLCLGGLSRGQRGRAQSRAIEGWKSCLLRTALEIRRQEMERITPVPAQQKAARSDAQLLACLLPTPQGLKKPEEAPQRM